MPPKLPSQALVIADGDAPDRLRLRSFARPGGIVVCTDGAFLKAARSGLKVDWIVGDMDSLPRGRRIPRGTRLVLDDNPDATDLEKAVRFLVKSGCREAVLAGTQGSRLDHSLAAFQILERYAPVLKLSLVHRGWRAEVVSSSTTLHTHPGRILSLLPLGRARLSLSGVRYPLRDEWLRLGSRGVSNAAASRLVRIRVRSGRVLLVTPL